MDPKMGLPAKYRTTFTTTGGPNNRTSKSLFLFIFFLIYTQYSRAHNSLLNGGIRTPETL